MSLVSATRIAKECDCGANAVGNWLRRGVLPDHLTPVDYVDHGTPYPTPVWAPTQLAGFRDWYLSRKAVSA